MPYMRTVKTTSGATAVQVVWSSRRGSREIEHLGSAHDEAELEALKAAAQQRIAAGQLELDLGLGSPGPSGPLPITSSRMGCLLDALCRAYGVLGFGWASGGDEVLADLVLARIIEPVSKLDSLRVLEEAGVAAASYATLKRRLAVYAKDSWRRKISAACAAHAGLGRASLVCMTSARCSSRPMRATGSARAAIRRSGGWNRRSPSACSPAPTASRSWCLPLRATRPRLRPCCRSSRSSWPPTTFPT